MREENPTDLEAQRRAAKEQERESALMKEQERSDLVAVMSTESGRRFMWGFLAATGMYNSSFTGNSTTFFNEGQRNIGLKYTVLMLQHCPELYLEMQKEAIAGKKDSQ